MIQWSSNDLLILDKHSADREKNQTNIDYQTDLSQNHLDNLREGMVVPTAQSMFNRADTGAANAFADYGDIMGRYRGFMDDPKANITGERIDPSSVNYSRTPEMGQALSGYGDFAQNGGFSPEAIRDIRERGISPIRAAYGNTMMEMNRARGLGGEGGASNYIAAASKAQRELPQQLSDATQNVNADIARMIQSGRLAGLGGLSSTAQTDTGFGQQAQLANQGATMQSRLANQGTNLAAQQANLGSRLSGLTGMSSLYSATPGQAQTFGNQVLGAGQNWLGAQGLQQQNAGQKIQGQLQQSQMPTGYQSILGNTGKTVGVIGKIGTLGVMGGMGG